MMVRRGIATLKALLRDESGNVLALAAVGLPIMIGCAALAVDTVQWVFAKRQLQAAADAAAIAGLFMHSSWSIVRDARNDLRESATTRSDSKS